MGCGASSSAKASAPTALEGTAREENASRTPGLQRDPATGAAHADVTADPAPGAPHAETQDAEQGSTSAVEDPLEKAAREAKQVSDARQQHLDAGTVAFSPVAGDLKPLRQTQDAEQGNTSAVEDPLEKAAREAKQTFDARQQRLDAGTEASSSPAAGSQVPMYTQIGHENVRHAREQWKQKLEEPPSLDLKPRNAQQDMQILRGQLGEKSVRIEVLHEDKRIVSFLLSSTFTDTASERNLLIADVVPYLQQFARKHNFDFRLVEMRWGIRAEASSAHQTSEICMAELERCQGESQGFSYVFLGCQKYGFRPFPAKIPKDVFEHLRK